MAFDPMTGEEIPEVTETNSFDPMTGEPIGAETEAPAFDPMTGEPIGAETEAPAFDPMTGEPIGAAVAAKAGIPLAGKIAIGVVAGAVAVGGIGYAVVSNIGGPGVKVVKAIENTLQGGQLITLLNDAFKSLEGDTATASVVGEVNDVEFTIASSADIKAKELSTNGSVTVDGVDIAYEFYMDESAAYFAMPDWLDEVFYYNYVEENDGYLIEGMEYFGLEQDDVNSLLQSLFQTTDDSQELEKALREAHWENLQMLEFDKVDAEKFEVDGKDRKCKGYSTVITEDILDEWLDRYEDIYSDYFDKLEDTATAYRSLGISGMSDLFEDLEDEIEDMDDVELTFYLYKDRVAAVEFAGDDLEGILEIRGGAYPTENMYLKVEIDGDDHELELTGKTNGTKEEQSLEADGDEVLNYSYDAKSGDFSVEAIDGSRSYVLEGTILFRSGELECTFDTIELPYADLDVEMTLTLTDKADIHRIDADKDDLFDAGNADEDDWDDLFDSIQEELDEMEDALYSIEENL